MSQKQSEDVELREKQDEPLPTTTTDTENSLKRKLDFEIIDLDSFEVVKSQKKVLGKIIRDLWQPLDNMALNSVYTMLHISLNKTMEKYIQNLKITEARKILTSSWISSNSHSFLNRLKNTNLPLPSSLTSAKINEFDDILNYDLVLKRNKYLQTLLSAEMNQLNDLNTHYNKLKLTYQVDLDYLKKFEKIVQKQESIPDLMDKVDDKISLLKSDNSGFIPENDKDCNEILIKLNKALDHLDNSTGKLQDTYEKLKVINNMIEMLI